MAIFEFKPETEKNQEKDGSLTMHTVLSEVGSSPDK